jgi:hypothetical protein
MNHRKLRGNFTKILRYSFIVWHREFLCWNMSSFSHHADLRILKTSNVNSEIDVDLSEVIISNYTVYQMYRNCILWFVGNSLETWNFGLLLSFTFLIHIFSSNLPNQGCQIQRSPKKKFLQSKLGSISKQWFFDNFEIFSNVLW